MQIWSRNTSPKRPQRNLRTPPSGLPDDKTHPKREPSDKRSCLSRCCAGREQFTNLLKSHPHSLGFQDFCMKNGSGQGHNLAVSVLFAPNLLDSDPPKVDEFVPHTQSSFFFQKVPPGPLGPVGPLGPLGHPTYLCTLVRCIQCMHNSAYVCHAGSCS